MISTKWINGDKGLEDAYAIRRKVFIEEQGVSEELELDGSDALCLHLLVFKKEIPIATGRILMEGNKCVLGRVAVLKAYRKQKYGQLVMKMLIRTSYNMGAGMQYVHAQAHASDFYKKLGFIAYGNPFLEANIYHISMMHEGDWKGE